MKQLAQLEALMRAGELTKVNEIIASLDLKRIPRTEAVRVANIANRADQSRAAVRLLYPIIHSEKESLAPANDQERIEYAEALRRTGLINEAREILQSVDLEKNPIGHLRLSFCYFNEWRYSHAIPHLRRLVAETKSEDYLQIIAKVNLAAALVHEELYSESLALLEEIQEHTRFHGQTLLLGNSLEMMAQVYIREGNWSFAENSLRSAEDAFGLNHNKYLFFVQKWRAIAKSLRQGVVEENLLQLRDQARDRHDWESERDCDLHIAVIKKDNELLKKVYFGTPYSSFRRRLLNMARTSFSPPDAFVWSQSQHPKRIFDIVKACSDDGSVCLDVGALPHQMMTLLSADFYRPISIGSAFNALFVGEKFGQQGSANRVSQVVMRLRRTFKEANMGLAIVETSGMYRIALENEAALRVVPEVAKVSREDLSWLAIKMQLAGGIFSRQDLERVTRYSSSKAKRLLSWAIDKGFVQSVGYGPTTKYKLAA